MIGLHLRFLCVFLLALLLGTLSPPAAEAAVTCRTTCHNKCHSCTRIFGKRRCTNLLPTYAPCYSACTAARTLACAVEAVQQPFHGNYCGINRKGDGYKKKPVDALDEACRRHDRCYDMWGRATCSCDKRLAADALKVAPTLKTSKARENAVATGTLFLTAPCINRP